VLSISRRCCVSIFFEASGNILRNSPKRIGPCWSRDRIRVFHFPWMRLIATCAELLPHLASRRKPRPALALPSVNRRSSLCLHPPVSTSGSVASSSNHNEPVLANSYLRPLLQSALRAMCSAGRQMNVGRRRQTHSTPPFLLPA
jgi:hypothetical protein